MRLEEVMKKEAEIVRKPRKIRRKTKRDLIIQELKEDWKNIKQALLEGKIKAKSIYRYLVEEKGLQVSDAYFYKVLNELLENDQEITESKSELKPAETKVSKPEVKKKEPKKSNNQLPPELEEERKKRMAGKVNLDELYKDLGIE